MNCNITCFDRVMHNVKELPDNKLKEAVEVIVYDGLYEFLSFCVENNCFTKEQSDTLFEGIVMWEDYDGNYWEEDIDKLNMLYDNVGITVEVFSELLPE